MSRIVLTSSVEVEGTPPRLWPLLTDTERMNRTLHMHAVRYESVDSSSAARFVAHTRLGGLPIVYEEEPFEFIVPSRYSVRRRMRGGLLEELVTRLELTPLPAATPAEVLRPRTRVTYAVEIAARAGFLAPFLRRTGRQRLAAMLADAEDVSRRLKGHRGPVEPAPVVDRPHLDRALTALREAAVGGEIVRRLGELVVTGHDADLAAIRPFELALAWDVDPRELLRTLLHAVKAGMFELRWALVCPSCLTFSEQVRGLDEIPPEGHCQLCDIGFELDIDRSVEATFVVHPGVRRLNDALFCIGGPGRTPHVLAQTNLAAGDGADFTAPQDGDRYRLFVRGGASLRVVVDEAAPGHARAVASETAFDTEEVRVAPGGIVRVINRTSAARHAKLERLVYATRAATAAFLAALDDFRRLFSADLLKRGTPLKVARVSLFFSDLTGSTALYSKIGDAAAFRLVDDHFDLLRAVVTAHEGVVVKTMGDAVMAAFHDDRHCLAAAIECLRRFEAFRNEREHGAAVGLKMGMYAGACYVVTANGTLDYFGQTVNVTARIQHQAQTGELVVEQATLLAMSPEERAGVHAAEHFEALAKGVDEPLKLVRLRLVGDPGQA